MKSFVKNIKSYLSFYLCSFLCVTIFFMYVAIIFHKDLNTKTSGEMLDYVFYIAIVAISLFSIFFINYAHSTFIKSRKKEFGVYISLGMNAKELKNLVLFENMIIAMAALVSGMLVGALFSRLFQMILISLLDVKDIEYSLDVRSFFVTILVFLIIFSINFYIMAKKIVRSDIQTLLTEARKNQKKGNIKRNSILACLGLVILVISSGYMIAIVSKEEWYSNPFGMLSYMLLSFLGVYLLILEGGILALTLIKKSKFYYSHLLSLTQLQHKYNQNRKIMFVLTILSTMNIFCVASPFSLLNLCETIAAENGSDLEFAVGEGMHENYEEVLRTYLKEDDIKEIIEIPLLLVETGKELSKIPVLDVETYNRYMKTTIHVPRGRVSNVILGWEPSNGGYSKGDPYAFQFQDESYSYEVVSSGNGKFIASSYGENLLLMNKTDFDDFTNKATESNTIRYCIIRLNQWKEKQDAVLDIEKTLEMDGYQVNSVAGNYLELKQGYSVFLFVFSVLGLLFFIAGGTVLYFRQYSELPETKRVFAQLFPIGISLKETKAIISQQLIVIFYIPVIFGSYLGLTLIYLMTHLMGGVAFVEEFMKNASYVVLFYLLCQIIFYFMTRRKYVNSIEVSCIQGE